MRCKTKKRNVKSSRKRRSKSKKMRGSGSGKGSSRGSESYRKKYPLTYEFLGSPRSKDKSESEETQITAIDDAKKLLRQAVDNVNAAVNKLNDLVES